MATFIVSKSDLFNLINQATVFMSDPVGTSQFNVENRIADVVPLSKDNIDFMDIKLNEVGVKILKKITPYTSGLQTTGGATEVIQYPYTITDNTDPDYPDSVVFQIYFYEGNNIGVQSYMIQQAIIEALSKYVIKEWLKSKGYRWQLYEQMFETSLNDIKSALMYGRKAKKIFRTL